MAVSKRILIVDDDVALCMGFAEAFQLSGWDATASTNFEDARNRLRSGRFDVLVVDVRLGNFNGLHLATLAHAHNAAKKVVAITGFDSPLVRAEASRSGTTYLVKPVEFQRLFELLTSES